MDERHARSVSWLRRAAYQDRGAEIFARIGGSGPPLLLLHGYPQTHVCWHKIAPELAREFTLVIPDLRGYGQAPCPTDAEHLAYSKRAMAADCIAVMRALGHERFMVASHDRGVHAPTGSRSTIRLPCRDSSRSTSCRQLGRLGRHAPLDGPLARFHWALLAQPKPFPETLIGLAT